MDDPERARVAEIQERWARVSPTPWSLDSTRQQVFASDGTTVATHSCDGFWAGSGPPLKAEDARAIALAPEDVAYLLQLIDALQTGEERAKE